MLNQPTTTVHTSGPSRTADATADVGGRRLTPSRPPPAPSRPRSRRDRWSSAPSRGVGVRALRRRELRLRDDRRDGGRRAVPHGARAGRRRPRRPRPAAAALAPGRVPVRLRRQPVGAAAGARPAGARGARRPAARQAPAARGLDGRRLARHGGAGPDAARHGPARPRRVRRRQRRVRGGDPRLQRLPQRRRRAARPAPRLGAGLRRRLRGRRVRARRLPRPGHGR
ncbi:MAG: hypothetical protein AVDCRST_MAG16-396 [uncultured Frankineae bacterium]|uniref:Uncharacterized protein n=1 Tax=uncultured Frankineae bacterium TaxID=437475 RepID=A0A6J4KU80_9ACTN|nr:MAG: hypothetical protein AVDCRST_MAG16-396 [uncultured Frankineae bacterium]